MGLEHRGGGVYYYRSRRVGRRVVKEYVTSGPAAVLIAQLEGLDTQRREFARWKKRDRAARRQRTAARVIALLTRATRLVGEALRASGWHPHRREWRKKRGFVVTTDLAILTQTWVTEQLAPHAGRLDPDTIAKAAKGDRSVLPAVEQYLGNPAATALWGDTGRHLLRKWVKLYAGTDVLTEQAVIRFASDLRSRLAGPTPTALEQLLAERVVLAWVAVGYFERWYANRLDKELMYREHEHHQKTVGFAHRQLLAAARALAKVRRAKLPDVLAVVNVTPTPDQGGE